MNVTSMVMWKEAPSDEIRRLDQGAHRQEQSNDQCGLFWANRSLTIGGNL